ncbi:hypothetical protein RDI58_010810 [Solanum bulbocastanum]|uniref:Protein kinase domain-containing protein n=1 Tax=Solanum bulbocastanum TaxID=147425 RepID=A0AAN8TQ49_SOLBU
MSIIAEELPVAPKVLAIPDTANITEMSWPSSNLTKMDCQKLLVYKFMLLGSLEAHLHDWNTRMKIAVCAAKGIEFLHGKANPLVIYRDLKCSNILLDEDYNPKLSDLGLANFGLVLLEIITGRSAIHTSRAAGEQNLVAWVREIDFSVNVLALWCHLF